MEGGYKRIYGLRAFSIRIRVIVWTGENDTEMISVDTNLFENGTKQYRFRLKTVQCGWGLIRTWLILKSIIKLSIENRNYLKTEMKGSDGKICKIIL